MANTSGPNGPSYASPLELFLKFIPWILGAGFVGFVFIALATDPWVIREAVEDKAGNITKPALDYNWEILWAWALLAYILFSFRFWDQVSASEHASLQLFGRPYCNIDSGATFAPLGIFTIVRLPKTTMQREYPAEPELIFRGELKERAKLPDGMVPPIRIPFSDSIDETQAETFFGDLEVKAPNGEPVQFITEVPSGDKKLDGLQKRVTAEPSVVVRLQIDDPNRFLGVLGSEGEVFRQIEDEVTSKLQEYLTRMSVAQALINQRWISIVLYNAVQRRLEEHANKNGISRDWGATLETVQLKFIHLNHELNDTISKAAAAPFAKNAVIIAAEGERKRKELEGAGDARAAQLLEEKTLSGRAAGLKKIAETIGVDGAEVQSAEVARAIADGGNTIVVGVDGVREIAGVAAAFTQKGKKRSGNNTSEPRDSD